MTRIDGEPTAVRTLTIRKVPVECVDVLKQAARENNRSMESQVKSVLEEWTAGYVAHEEMSNSDLLDKMRELLDGEYIEGDEFDVRDHADYGRPLPFGDRP